MQYVGVTGFMSRAEVDAALEALPAGLTLMCGVLASAKTLRGERNRWWRRYPDPGRLYEIFSPDPRCLNLIHYSTSDGPPDAATVSRLQHIGGPRCAGFQFNGVWPEPWTLAALAGGTVVLQANPRHPSRLAKLPAAMRALQNCEVHVLIDGSGGRGEPMNLVECDAVAAQLRREYGDRIGVALAGGLCADALPSVTNMVRAWGASIDAEGKLRDGDDGGVLNMDKVRAYLAAAGEMMLPGDRKRM